MLDICTPFCCKWFDGEGAKVWYVLGLISRSSVGSVVVGAGAIAVDMMQSETVASRPMDLGGNDLLLFLIHCCGRPVEKLCCEAGHRTVVCSNESQGMWL